MTELLLPRYPPPVGVHPPMDFAGFASTALRHPKQPVQILQILPQRLTEVTGPVFGDSRVG